MYRRNVLGMKGQWAILVIVGFFIFSLTIFALIVNEATAQTVPEIEWIRQFGSSASDFGFGISVDDSGVYVVGDTKGALPGKSFAGGFNDAFVRKYDTAGTEIWTRQFGTSDNDALRAVAVDSTGVYVAGDTGGSLPGQTNSGSATDAFVRKYDVGGTEVWTRQFGVSVFVTGNAIDVDATGVYVAGSVLLGALPSETNQGLFDAFVRKYDTNGNEVWTRQFGGVNEDHARAISVGTSGVYVGGEIDCLSADPSLCDVFIRKYDTAGTEIWTRQFGTAVLDVATGIFSDTTGVYIVGLTEGTLPGQTSTGFRDGFVKKYDTAGTEVWTRQFGGTSSGALRGISGDTSGVYVAGITAPGQLSSLADVLIRKYDTAGTEIWTKQFGSSGGDQAFDISIHNSGLYVVGQTSGTLPGQTSIGDGDAFVAKLDTVPPLITLTGADPQPIELGDPYTELGATAIDDFDGDLTGSIDIDISAVDTNTPGSYIVTYNVNDSSGNAAAQVTRTINVVDTTVPVITLNGDPTVTLEVGIDTYTELGATVTDNDPAYTGTVTIGGDTVDPNTVGTYIVTYNAPADPSGNPAAQITRTINVVDTTDTDGDGVTDSDEVNVYGTDPLDVDTDGDSLEDGWEIFGIDANSDGTIDLSLGADPLHKDIFVEVDFMQLHQPNADAMNDLVTAFAISPVSNPDGLDGINLHIQVDNAMAHFNCITVWSGFDSLKSALFGTTSERADPNASNILAAKRLVYHYGLFVHGQCNTGYSGIGERPGDDFIISKGNSAAGHNSQINGRTQDAGIFMHEIGHNFGLRHGGGDNVNCKPNYLSTMKYNRMYPTYIPDRPLDYSREKIDDLVESNLDESKGVPSTSGLKTMYGPHIFPDISYKISLTGIAIDWNRDGDSEDSGVMADINLFVGLTDCSVAGLQTLTGFNDWSNLVYNFRTTSNFDPAAHQDPLDTPELTNEEIKAMQTLHIESLDQAIQNLPDESFTKPKVADARKKAFHNKLQAVTAMILADEFLDAIDKLTHDIRTKMDGSVGGNPKNDWIDPEAQAELIEILDNFVATLEKWVEPPPDPPTPEDPPAKVEICHKGKTMSVSEKSADKHIVKHGDTEGACE